MPMFLNVNPSYTQQKINFYFGVFFGQYMGVAVDLIICFIAIHFPKQSAFFCRYLLNKLYVTLRRN